MQTERQKLIEIIKVIIGDIDQWPIEDKIRFFAAIFKPVDVKLALAIAQVESTKGKNQLSPTGASGVFQLTTIAQKDQLWDMRKYDDDLGDVASGCNFLRVLTRRFKGDMREIVFHYCDPKVREDYFSKVKKELEKL